ncbi:hypothetical protein BLOT_005244 [Blomia tropicalis]|nr:hypothetical protein BLOT_005244 [Blomia tropicalis]
MKFFVATVSLVVILSEAQSVNDRRDNGHTINWVLPWSVDLNFMAVDFEPGLIGTNDQKKRFVQHCHHVKLWFNARICG